MIFASMIFLIEHVIYAFIIVLTITDVVYCVACVCRSQYKQDFETE